MKTKRSQWRDFLYFVFFALLILPGVAAQVSAKEVSGPTVTRPRNPAVMVPYPPKDTTRCQTSAEKAMGLVVAVANSCTREIYEKAPDYVIVTTGHLLWGLAVPGMQPIVLAELTKKLGKDATRCILKGLVKGGGGTPEDKQLAGASVDMMLVWIDRKKYMEKFPKAWKHFAEHGRKNILEDEDRKKFVTFLDKKTWDRATKRTKESDFVGAVRKWFETAARKAEKAHAEARASIEVCDFDKANEALGAAQVNNIAVLQQMREAIRKQEKHVRCLWDEYWQEVKNEPLQGDYPGYVPRDDPRANDWLKANRALEELELKDKAQVSHMQELADLAATVQAKNKEVERIRDEFNVATDRCDWQGAAAKIEEIKTYTWSGWCAVPLKNMLAALQEKQAANEKIIADTYQKAVALKNPSCTELRDTADFLEKASKGLCVNAANTWAKITSLRNLAESCDDSKRKGPAGPVVLKRIDVVNKGWEPYAVDGQGGSITQKGGSAGYVNEYRWTPVPGDLSAEGMTMTLTVTTQLSVAQSMALGMSAGSDYGFEFKFYPNPHTVSGQPPLYLVTEKGDSKSLKVDVKPPMNLTAGSKVSFWVGAAWGPWVEYVYEVQP